MPVVIVIIKVIKQGGGNYGLDPVQNFSLAQELPWKPRWKNKGSGKNFSQDKNFSQEIHLLPVGRGSTAQITSFKCFLLFFCCIIIALLKFSMCTVESKRKTYNYEKCGALLFTQERCCRGQQGLEEEIILFQINESVIHRWWHSSKIHPQIITIYIPIRIMLSLLLYNPKFQSHPSKSPLLFSSWLLYSPLD